MCCSAVTLVLLCSYCVFLTSVIISFLTYAKPSSYKQLCQVCSSAVLDQVSWALSARCHLVFEVLNAMSSETITWQQALSECSPAGSFAVQDTLPLLAGV